MDLKEIWSEYGKERPSFAKKIARYFSPVADWRTKAILDVGCGDGGIASAFAAMDADTTAIEYDAGRVAQMVKRSRIQAGTGGCPSSTFQAASV